MSENIVRREFPVEVEASGDGRTLDVRIIPYNVVSRVSDDGGRSFYSEEWMPGAFERQLSAAHRVLVNFEHQQGIQGTVGKGQELRESKEALEGTFRMLNHSDADKALELVNSGVLSGVSIEAVPEKSVREDGVMRRVKARLVNIALCRFPAYAGAEVLAVRERPEGAMTVDEVRAFLARGVADKDAEQAKDQETETTGEAVAEPEAEPTEAPSQKLTLEEELEMECEAALSRVGYEPLVTRAITKKPWDGSAARFSDEQYKRSCLIDRGGDDPVKQRCSLPVLEPNGDINVNALAAAAGRLRQTAASSEQKAAAARKLRRYYSQAGLEPPASVLSLAGR